MRLWFAALPAVLFLAGCCLWPHEPLAAGVTASRSPIDAGGIVGASAAGILNVAYEEAARRLGDWEALVRSQSETSCAAMLGGDPDPSGSGLEGVARAGGMDPAALSRALSAWRAEEPGAFPEARRLKAEIAGADGPGAALCGPGARGPLTGTVFRTSRGTITALGECISERTAREAVLVEIHFWVSRSYSAGLNVYHLMNEPPGRPRLTVRLFSWVPQAEGFLGAIPRALAGGEIEKQAERTWREVAAHLQGTTDLPASGP